MQLKDEFLFHVRARKPHPVDVRAQTGGPSGANTLSTEKMIRRELFSWDTEVADQYMDRYQEQLERFVESMAAAHNAWREFDNTLAGDSQRAHISALIFGALSLHVMSTKFLTWGLLVPAGSTMRQVLEIISMTFLASKPSLGYLDRYASGRYSTNFAIRDVLKNAEKLSLSRSALEVLRNGRDFYNKFNHPTLITIATYIQFSGGNTYFDASFDPDKQYAYDKEVSTRVQVAGLLENMIDGVRCNLDEGETSASCCLR
jgi:hypothetical protein